MTVTNKRLLSSASIPKHLEREVLRDALQEWLVIWRRAVKGAPRADSKVGEPERVAPPPPPPPQRRQGECIKSQSKQKQVNSARLAPPATIAPATEADDQRARLVAFLRERYSTVQSLPKEKRAAVLAALWSSAQR